MELNFGLLSPASSASASRKARFAQTRLKRIFVDYLLRRGYYATAQALTEQAGIQDLVDTQLFLSIKRPLEDLAKNQCKSALAWCGSNRAKLNRIESTLEFELRLQEFVELVRQKDMSGGIQYAQKYFPPWATSKMEQIQEAMAMLAFSNLDDGMASSDNEQQLSPAFRKYRRFFGPARWLALAEHFRTDFFRLNGLTDNSLLQINLQAGLSALKTP